MELRAPDAESAAQWVYKLRLLQLDDSITLSRRAASGESKRETSKDGPVEAVSLGALGAAVAGAAATKGAARGGDVAPPPAPPPPPEAADDAASTSAASLSSSTLSAESGEAGGGRATRRASVRKGDALTPPMIETLRPSMEVAQAGFLLKRASSRRALRAWHRRFFVATGAYLRYFADDSAGRRVLGVIDLAGADVAPAADDGRDFELRFDDGAMRFRADDEPARDAWVATLLELKELLVTREAAASLPLADAVPVADDAPRAGCCARLRCGRRRRAATRGAAGPAAGAAPPPPPTATPLHTSL